MKTRYFLHLMIWAIWHPHRTKNYYYLTEKTKIHEWVAYEMSKYLTEDQYRQLTKNRI